MPDAHKGHGSWIEQRDSPSDREGGDAGGSASDGEPAFSSGEGDSADFGTANWQAYLDSSPETTLTAPHQRPDADSGHRPPRGGEPSAPQAVPDPRVTELQRRWLFTQAQLLDDPGEAVLEAGRLIGDAMRLATGTVDEQRNRIERRWQADAHVDTDELRSIMQRYRSLFQYVLAADSLVDEVEAVRREHKAATTAPPHGPSPGQAAAAQDGLAEVLQPGRAARYEAEDPGRRRSWRGDRAAQWLTGLGTSSSRGRRTRRLAGAALLLLVGLSAVYAWWRWQRPGSGETVTRALTVEPLPYARHAQSAPTPAEPVTAELGSRVGAGDAAGLESASAEALSSQPGATRPPVGASRPTGREPTQAAQPTDLRPSIRPADPEPAIPELQPAAPTVETAVPTTEDARQTGFETLPVETESAPPEPARTPTDLATVAAQQATSTSLPSVDLSQIRPHAAEPESVPTDSQPAAPPSGDPTAATAEEEIAEARPTPPAVEEPDPQPAVAESAVDRGDLVALSDPEVARPVLVVQPRAEYPIVARRMRREATVELRVLVDEQGLPSRIESAGRSAGLGFDDAARAAVERARWRPATKDGVPVKVWIQTAVRFQLDGR